MNKGKKHRKIGAFFGRGFIINSMRKQSTGLFTVKSARTFEFRGSSPSALTTKQKKTPAGVFLFWQGQKDLNPRHAVLERKARFQLSRVLKYSPHQIPHKNSTFRI